VAFKTDGAPMGVILSAALREAFEVRGIKPEERLDLLKVGPTAGRHRQALPRRALPTVP
jgi:hypothetical protein